MVATCEKCASGDWWPGALGDVADGTLTSDVWAPELGGSGTDIVMKGLSGKYTGKTLSIGALAYTAAMVLMDSIVEAKSTDGAAINAVIAKTDKDYPIGRVKFAEDHGTRLTPTMLQWQDKKMVRILPPGQGAVAIAAPAKGLQ
jgi:branched-chain amino acid transport system substrate-binding protein